VGTEPAEVWAAAEPAARPRFLAEASRVLAGSLDYETTLATVARLAVPALADRCVVDLLDPDGSIRLVAVAHVDPAKEELMRELRRRYPPDPSRTYGLWRGLRRGRPELVPEVGDARLEAIAHDADHLRLLRELGFRSSMFVPLLARNRTLGQLIFHVAESGRRYGPDDLALAEDLAARCALAIDNARLYREAQEQAATLAQLNAALHEAAGARDRALAEARAAIRMRDEFLAAATHDLKTPLAAIKGQAQLLRRRAAGGPAGPADLASGLARIDAAATRMNRLVEELLDVAQLRIGQALRLQKQPTDLVALARAIAAEQQHGAPHHRLEVATVLPQLVGRWDRDRLERVLTNLLGNAVKYSPSGGEITICVGKETDAAGEWAVLAVRDQGIGVPAADLPHIFEPFYRAANTRGTVRGSGLGLASARQIAAQHGGRLTVVSEEGAGSTFTVRLPLEPDQ
jgi:signal transduction histidine kinase